MSQHSNSSSKQFFRQLISHGNQVHCAARRVLQWQLNSAHRWLLLLLTVAVVVGCNGSAVNQNETSTSEPLSDNCRVIQHVMGESCVPNSPQKVVTIIHHMVGHTLAIDVKPVGSNVLSLQQANGDYLKTQTYMGNATEGIQLTGLREQANIEKILSLNPDLILATDRSEESYPQLSQIAPTVVFTFEDIVLDWKQGFALVSEVFGRESQAQQALDKYYRRIEELKASLGDRYQNQTISVAGIFGSNVFAFTQSSFPGSILSDLGLTRPEAQRVNGLDGAIRNLSEESLEQNIDGDVLFFLAFSDDPEATFRELQQRPLWNQLRAFQKGQAYLVNNYAWVGSNAFAAAAVIDELYKYLVETPLSDT